MANFPMTEHIIAREVASRLRDKIGPQPASGSTRPASHSVSIRFNAELPPVPLRDALEAVVEPAVEELAQRIVSPAVFHAMSPLSGIKSASASIDGVTATACMINDGSHKYVTFRVFVSAYAPLAEASV